MGGGEDGEDGDGEECDEDGEEKEGEPAESLELDAPARLCKHACGLDSPVEGEKDDGEEDCGGDKLGDNGSAKEDLFLGGTPAKGGPDIRCPPEEDSDVDEGEGVSVCEIGSLYGRPEAGLWDGSVVSQQREGRVVVVLFWRGRGGCSIGVWGEGGADLYPQVEGEEEGECDLGEVGHVNGNARNHTGGPGERAKHLQPPLGQKSTCSCRRRQREVEHKAVHPRRRQPRKDKIHRKHKHTRKERQCSRREVGRIRNLLVLDRRSA